MAKEKSPAFQFYPKDFLANYDVMTMTMEERGMYITLLSVCWLDDGLTTDATAFRILCGGIEPTEKVLNCFKEVDGKLINPRLEKEKKKQKDWSKKQSDRAKGRWNKKIDPMPRHSHGNAEPAMPRVCSSSSSSSSSSSYKRVKKDTPPTQDMIDARALAESYRSIRGDVSTGVKNAKKWISDGASVQDMQKSIDNYRKKAMENEPQYRKKFSNFFGRDDLENPEWKDWINPTVEAPALVKKEVPANKFDAGHSQYQDVREADMEKNMKKLKDPANWPFMEERLRNEKRSEEEIRYAASQYGVTI